MATQTTTTQTILSAVVATIGPTGGVLLARAIIDLLAAAAGNAT